MWDAVCSTHPEQPVTTPVNAIAGSLQALSCKRCCAPTVDSQHAKSCITFLPFHRFGNVLRNKNCNKHMPAVASYQTDGSWKLPCADRARPGDGLVVGTRSKSTAAWMGLKMASLCGKPFLLSALSRAIRSPIADKPHTFSTASMVASSNTVRKAKHTCVSPRPRTAVRPRGKGRG